MSLILENPEAEIHKITSFMKATLARANCQKVVIAVSGGIDSALSLSLLCRALPVENIIPVLLPYSKQSTVDSYEICAFNHIPKAQIREINIEPMATSFFSTLGVQDELNKGNILARTRMIVVYDLAKTHAALVCGTENKSEKYLGYFTRFGDEASDLEPLQHLYKTQVRQLAAYLGLPEGIVKKAPSAELWDKQTDEKELGFSYETADLVLEQYIDEGVAPEKIAVKGVTKSEVKNVIDRVKSQQFKHEVPYTIDQ